MNKSKLLDRIQRGQILVEAAFGELTDAERNQTGTMEHWSAKDTLAHIAAWQSRWVSWLAPLADDKPFADEGPEPVEEEDRANAKIFAEFQPCSWEQIHAAYQTASRRILRLVALLSEEDSSTPRRFAWLKEQTLAARLSGTFYWHVQDHLARMFLARREPERAIKVAEEFSSQVGADEPARERGVAFYNLACYCALAGKSALAISNLKPAFSIYPELIELSKKDTDLDMLRGLAEFESVYQS
jgi:uncharacterized damage-inducible protein DinB